MTIYPAGACFQFSLGEFHSNNIKIWRIVPWFLICLKWVALIENVINEKVTKAVHARIFVYSYFYLFPKVFSPQLILKADRICCKLWIRLFIFLDTKYSGRHNSYFVLDSWRAAAMTVLLYVRWWNPPRDEPGRVPGPVGDGGVPGLSRPAPGGGVLSRGGGGERPRRGPLHGADGGGLSLLPPQGAQRSRLLRRIHSGNRMVHEPI